MMQIEEAQQRIDQWIKTYGVRYFNELTNMALLTEEVGELARLVAREYGEQSFREEINSTQVHEKMADEMADVFFVLCCLANQMDINLTSAIEKNLDKKTKRDHSRHLENRKLNPET